MELELCKDIDICFYIPSHKNKMASRGYNQAELLASEICKKIDLEISHGELLKIKKTKEQNKLQGFERRENLMGAYYYDSNRSLKAKRILLIDDIVTTGSTMRECSKILMGQGAASIKGLALTSSKKI